MIDVTENDIIINGQPSMASKVLGKLWVGDAPPHGLGLATMQFFDTIVLCAMEYQLDPTFFPGVEVLYAPMNDDGTPMTAIEKRIAVTTAGKVIERLSRGARVLTTCRQGRNRSGLIACLAMCIGAPRLTSSQAIGKLREARGQSAMSNRFFLSFWQTFRKDSIPEQIRDLANRRRRPISEFSF